MRMRGWIARSPMRACETVRYGVFKYETIDERSARHDAETHDDARGRARSILTAEPRRAGARACALAFAREKARFAVAWCALADSSAAYKVCTTENALPLHTRAALSFSDARPAGIRGGLAKRVRTATEARARFSVFRRRRAEKRRRTIGVAMARPARETRLAFVRS